MDRSELAPPDTTIEPVAPEKCLVCDASGPSDRFEVAPPIADRGAGYHYRRCRRCGSLTLLDPPLNFDPYYSTSEYYSVRRLDAFDRVEARVRTRASFRRTGWTYRWLARHSLVDPALASLGHLDPPRSARLLDVGCGSGRLLQRLRFLGFSDLTGLDPFTAARSQPGLLIARASLPEALRLGAFDVVMFHHSLEHTHDPDEQLGRAGELLAPGGTLLLRLPVLGEAFDRLGAAWPGLDPPRHLFLPSVFGCGELLARNGFRARDAYFDSNEWQMIPNDPAHREVARAHRSRWGTVRSKLFDRGASRGRIDSERLNAAGLGDNIVIYAERRSQESPR